MLKSMKRSSELPLAMPGDIKLGASFLLQQSTQHNMNCPSMEGFANLSVPAAGKSCQTYYKVHGDLHSAVVPLIVVHGGPGATHQYLLPFADLSSSPYQIPVVLYDQVGCGHSTRLREKAGDTEFWTVQLFIDELDNLITHLGIANQYALLGHSWGAMLCAEFAVRCPTGLKKLILASGPADMGLWVEATKGLLKTMSQDVQDAVLKHENAGTTDSSEYQEAMTQFAKQFVCRSDPLPAEVSTVFEEIEQDPTVYGTMQGPSEFNVTGSLKTWSIISDIHKINVPTLLTNGGYDEAQDSVITPFFKLIRKVKWYTFGNSAHMAHWEERERYMRLAGDFLTQY
ncbi:hypothetical protein AcV5_001105 [Taiwanofungus camphoratus]|nr:hypothetical protein AcV5_001105 [Antrodia cinnamomea]